MSTAQELATLTVPQSLENTLGRLFFSPRSDLLVATVSTVHNRRLLYVWNLPLIRQRLRRMGLDWEHEQGESVGSLVPSADGD